MHAKLFKPTEWVSVQGLTSHLTRNRSFRRRVFPGNQLHWYWQPKTIKYNTTYTRNTKEKQKKTALANKTIYTLIWYAFYDLRSGNEVGPILTAPEPTWGLDQLKNINKTVSYVVVCGQRSNETLLLNQCKNIPNIPNTEKNVSTNRHSVYFTLYKFTMLP